MYKVFQFVTNKVVIFEESGAMDFRLDNIEMHLRENVDVVNYLENVCISLFSCSFNTLLSQTGFIPK